MTRVIRQGNPTQKNPRGNPAHDHSPDDRRHARPSNVQGVDEARRAEKHHHKH